MRLYEGLSLRRSQVSGDFIHGAVLKLIEFEITAAPAFNRRILRAHRRDLRSARWDA